MTGATPWLLLAGVWLIYGAFGLIVSSLAPLVGLIESDLNISHSAMGSILGAWQLIYIGAAIPSGMLLDRQRTIRLLRGEPICHLQETYDLQSRSKAASTFC